MPLAWPIKLVTCSKYTRPCKNSSKTANKCLRYVSFEIPELEAHQILPSGSTVCWGRKQKCSRRGFFCRTAFLCKTLVCFTFGKRWILASENAIKFQWSSKQLKDVTKLSLHGYFGGESKMVQNILSLYNWRHLRIVWSMAYQKKKSVIKRLCLVVHAVQRNIFLPAWEQRHIITMN